MFTMFCWQLYEMNPENCCREKLGDKDMENWHKAEDMENELSCEAMISYV